MERLAWAGVREILLAVTALFLLPYRLKPNGTGSFQSCAFGGKAFHSNQDMKINSRDNGDPFHGTIHGVTLNDSGTFGDKLTAWYLPRKYNWQPQVGFELDFTRFTADLHPK